MKKYLWLAAAVVAALALFAACPGSGTVIDNGQEGFTGEFPVFSNAQMVMHEQFPNEHNPGFYRTQWKFFHEHDAPEDPATFLGARYLIIASRGGGTVSNLTTNPSTQFNGNGIEPVAFKVDATNNNWGLYTSRVFQPQANPVTNLIEFQRTANEIVFFVFDLAEIGFHLRTDVAGGSSDTRQIAINTTSSEIVIPINDDGMIHAFGAFQAYITNASLTMNPGDIELRNDGGGSGVNAPHNRLLGWLTRHPTGLTVAQ